MKVLPHSLLLSIFFVVMVFNHAAAQDAVPGQWLVRLPAHVSPDNLKARLQARVYAASSDPVAGKKHSNAAKTARVKFEIVSESLNIWRIRQADSTLEILPWLLQQPEVVSAQQNHYLSLRSNLLPDDPLFIQQWQYLNDGSNGGIPNADLDADLAWDISTGGMTMAGDSIVIAVIDGGVSKTHPDLVQNLWRNTAETPNDGIDNDENGYVDDFLGWNVFAQNDNIQGITSMHGTPVTGIIGASGNNKLGVTGVNWKVKIMFVAGGNLESDLLSAYDYILRARLKYNATNGAAGAFVVAANCSWGIDYGMPANAPLWCAAFDEMGEAGILSVAATANTAVNVDLVGDLPTTCPSDFLLSVTSLNKMDQLAPAAAWGPVNIDLGAYGEGIFTTSTANQYGVHAGTSFAAPQVAGAIGLLYAAPCPMLIAEAKNNPKAAALWVKNLLLNSVTPNLTLASRTLSGGRLNLFHLLQAYQDQCPACPAPFSLKTQNVSGNSVLLKWSETPSFQMVRLRWRAVGAADWTIVEDLMAEYQLAGLTPCVEYEFSLQSTCHNGDTSAWSLPLGFVTPGCCDAPSFAWTATPTEHSATVTWPDLEDFVLYKVRFKALDSTAWQTILSVDTALVVPYLSTCTAYTMQIQGWCAQAWIDLTPLFTIKTLGCGACTEQAYCSASAQEAVEEWIAAVQIGDWMHDSGGGGGGYQNLISAQVSSPQIAPETTVALILTPGFWGTAYKEYFRVYIDFNLDGDFDEPDELAFDPGFSQDGVVVGSFIAPAFTQPGSTRMRVLMKYTDPDPIPPAACGTFSFGQVEDYCVDLVDSQTDAKLSYDSSAVLKIYPQPATNLVWINVTNPDITLMNLKIWDVSGRLLLTDSSRPLRNGAIYLDTTAWPSGIYLVTVESEGKVLRGKLLKL